MKDANFMNRRDDESPVVVLSTAGVRELDSQVNGHMYEAGDHLHYE